MRWFSKLAIRGQMLFQRGEAVTRLNDELEFHLEHQIAENCALGMSATEARQAALRSFGNPAVLREQTCATWSWNRLESLWSDCRHETCALVRRPGVTLTIIGTLALGIGAATAMFTVVDHMLLRPIPFASPERLIVMLESSQTRKNEIRDVPWLDVAEWMRRSRSFEEVGFTGHMAGQNYLLAEGIALPVTGITVSPNLFSLLGEDPLLGRGFVIEEASFTLGRNTGGVVLSYAAWMQVWNGDRNVLGKVVHINDQLFTVIGVMRPDFVFPADAGKHTPVWIVVQLGPNDQQRNRLSTSYAVVARLRPGVTLPAARSEMESIQKAVSAAYPDAEMRDQHATVSLTRLRDTLVDADVKEALLALLAASGALWLIATMNATNLLLARNSARQREIAMRRALGASRGRVLQQMVIEGLVLSGAAALLGLTLALAGIRLAESARPTHLKLDLSIGVDPAIIGVLSALTVLTALLATAWPVLMAIRAPIQPALKQGGHQIGPGRRHHRLRGALVALQIAMSLALLGVCGLLLRTIYTLRHVPLGYRTDHILVANLDVPSYRFQKQNIPQVLYQPLLDRVQHLNGVQAAGLMSEVPLGQSFNITLTLVQNGHAVAARLKPVTPQIQKVFGFKMLAGRYFQETDTPNSGLVALVNPAFVRIAAPDKRDLSSILGSKFWSFKKGAETHIVGVIDDQRQTSITEAANPEVEICLCQVTPDSGIYQPSTVSMDLAMRTEHPPREMTRQLRAILKQASPELENATITTMDQIVEDSYGSQRLAAHLLEIFGGAALLLCIAGLYGLLAYLVAQRTREIGVRIALGAGRTKLLWMVLRQAGTMLLVGTIAGTGLTLASGRLVRRFLYGVSAHDAGTLLAATVILLATGLLAAWLPARRAANVDPMEALRAE